MRHCNGCGGIVGRDCFNPIECEWITQQMEIQAQEDAEIEHYNQIQNEHFSQLEKEYYKDLEEYYKQGGQS